ncbi:MAG: prolyl oligopeptidase family serine peptidase [Clostridia bacterium]|nr:prolyl oligopeptidase family serine peptidase [Clostridia bacterium]
MKKLLKKSAALIMVVGLLGSVIPSSVAAREGSITHTTVNTGDYTVIAAQPYGRYMYVTTNDADVPGVRVLRKNAQNGYDDITPETVSVDVALEGSALAAATSAGDLKGPVRNENSFDAIAVQGNMLAVAFEFGDQAKFDDTVYHTAPSDQQDQQFCNGFGVRLYSLENPELPRFLACCYANNVRGIEFYNNFMYVIQESNEVQVMDTSKVGDGWELKKSWLLKINDEDFKATSIRVLGDRLYLGGYIGSSFYDVKASYVQIYDISGGKEQNPELLATRRITRDDGAESLIRSIAVNDNVVAALDSVEAGDDSKISRVVLIGNNVETFADSEPVNVITKHAKYGWDMAKGWTRYVNMFKDDYLFVAGGNGHFSIFDISNPAEVADKEFFYTDDFRGISTIRSNGSEVFCGAGSGVTWVNPPIKGIFHKFVIDSPDLLVGTPSFTSNGIELNQPTAGKIDSHVKVSNNSSAAKTVYYVAAYYDNGTLAGVNFVSETINGHESRVIDNSIVADRLDDTHKVKYMYWDKNMKPVGEVYEISSPQYSGSNIFDAYINDVPTMDVWCDPRLKGADLTGEAIDTLEDGVKVYRFRFRSMDVDGFPNMPYCIMAIPAGASAENKVPGILQVHGGSGKAEETLDLVVENARNGYASLTFDCPAWCNLYEVSKEEYDSYPKDDKRISDGKYYVGYSTNIGRWITESGNGLGYGPYEVKDGTVTRNSTYGTIVAGLQAFNYLASQDFVDETKMGITGISMGGYTTTMLASLLGDKVKAAYSIYGCGYYDKGSSFIHDVLEPNWNPDAQIWLDNLDAGRYANRMTANYFVGGAINDYFFYPEAVMATLNEIPNSNQAFSANSFHNLFNLPNSDKYREEIFKYYLKGEGYELPVVTVKGAAKQADGSMKITFTPEVAQGLKVNSTKLWYSPVSQKYESPESTKINTNRNWTDVTPAANGDGTYSAVIPASAVSEGAEWTVIAEDSRFNNGGLAGGTYVYNTKYEF